MVSFTIIAAAAILGFSSTSFGAALPNPVLEQQDALACTAQGIEVHSFGGGGAGQAYLDQYLGGINLLDKDGNFIRAIPGTFNTGDDGAATNVIKGTEGNVLATMYTVYDAASNHFTRCTYTTPGNATQTVGKEADKIHPDVVSQVTSTCTIPVNDC